MSQCLNGRYVTLCGRVLKNKTDVKQNIILDLISFCCTVLSYMIILGEWEYIILSAAMVP